MGSSEVDKSSKEGKATKDPKTPASQEQSSVAPGMVAADWSGFQAYSPMPPHGFVASSPQPHPYMWGVQQFIPPYGTPPHPYVTMYPHGGLYTHPTMAPGSYPFSPFAMPSPNCVVEASGNTPSTVEVEGKASEGKEKLPIKRSKGRLGSLNMITRKNNESGKTAGASANDGNSKSADSASDGSSEGSDANSQNESQEKSGGRQVSGEPVHNGTTIPNPMANQNAAMVPMDYWGATSSSAMRGQVPAPPVVAGMVNTGTRDNNVQAQHWIQDERELKRQRRKQSNRESARRSRLRKQAECDELAKRAEAIKEENASLRAEVARIRSEYEQLLAQNASLKERLGELSDQDDPNQNDQHSEPANHMQNGQ